MNAQRMPIGDDEPNGVTRRSSVGGANCDWMTFCAPYVIIAAAARRMQLPPVLRRRTEASLTRTFFPSAKNSSDVHLKFMQCQPFATRLPTHDQETHHRSHSRERRRPRRVRIGTDGQAEDHDGAGA